MRWLLWITTFLSSILLLRTKKVYRQSDNVISKISDSSFLIFLGSTNFEATLNKIEESILIGFENLKEYFNEFSGSNLS